MKTLIIFIAFFLFICKNSYSQTISRYDTCLSLKQYEGEWRSINGQDTIRLFFRYNRYLSLDDEIAQTYILKDRLFGWHEYKSGNTIIESNYQNRLMALPYDFNSYPWNNTDFSIFLSIPNCNDSYFELRGTIDDYHKPQKWGGHDVIAKLDATRTVMTWRQRLHEGLINPPYTTMTLPYTFVLIKQ